MVSFKTKLTIIAILIGQKSNFPVTAKEGGFTQVCSKAKDVTKICKYHSVHCTSSPHSLEALVVVMVWLTTMSVFAKFYSESIILFIQRLTFVQ